MLSSEVKKYADYYGVICGKNNIFFTNNDTAYESAISLLKKGISVHSIIDIRENSNSSIVKEAQDLGLKIYWSHTIVDTHGYKRLKQISIMAMESSFADSEIKSRLLEKIKKFQT